MNLQKIFLIGALTIVSVLILQQWNHDYPTTKEPAAVLSQPSSVTKVGSVNYGAEDMPVLSDEIDKGSSNLMPNYPSIKVTTDVLKVEICTNGGDITNLDLLKYPEFLTENNDSPPFTLLSTPNASNNNSTTFIAQSALAKTDGPKANKQRPTYSSKKTEYSLANEDQLVVDLALTTSKADIIKRFIFYKNSYQIGVEYHIHNKSNSEWKDQFYAQLKRDDSKDPSEITSKAPVNTYIGGAVKTIKESYKKLPFNTFAKEPFKEKIVNGYAAIGQHYFVTAWIPAKNKEYTYYTKKSSDDFNFIGFFDGIINLEPGQNTIIKSTLYAGPKDQDKLKKIADGLDLTIDYGILWFIAQPLFMILQWIYKFLGNWGWSIIFLTILVKALFYPLNATSFRSMAKMRKLTPKLQQIKEKYADDKQKLSQAMMELYKKEKVNPLGGCLPIIIQMPVFIALYWVLLESVELRQASWMFWIKDLSVMDPYFILPVIMGASMFFQQTLNPPATDPMQAKVMKFMPLIFTFFFLWFPSGLVLYWITNNLISIAQQVIITKKIDKK